VQYASNFIVQVLLIRARGGLLVKQGV